MALQRRDKTTTMAAFGHRLIICTHEPELAATAETVIGSVQLAHDAFDPPTERVQSSLIRESHGVYFEQRRRSLWDAVGWSAQQPGAARAGRLLGRAGGPASVGP